MNKEEKIIEALQEVERITQMQFMCKSYIEGKYSIYNYSGGDYNDCFVTGVFTDFDTLDETLDIDLNGCNLEEVVSTLIAQGIISKKYVKVLTYSYSNLDILF